MNTSGHYYTVTGQPAHFVPRAKGGGTRPTTVRDAKQNGFVPSVTTVLKILDKPALQDWLIRQSVMAVVTAPEIQGEALDDRITRILTTDREQDAEAQAARDRGTELHAGLESFLQGRGETVSPELRAWIQPAWDWVQKIGVVERTEFILVGNGYGGKADLQLQTPTGHTIVDFKTSKKLPEKGSWPEHKLQLGAYAAAARLPAKVTVANLYISTVQPGQIAWFEIEDWLEEWECFKHLLCAWRHLNGFPPL
jgi:CRISPR/Cas system-associated exonuclease Cas4 (RecB family)